MSRSSDRSSALIALGAMLATLFWLWAADRACRLGLLAVGSDAVAQASRPGTAEPAPARGVVALAKRVYAEFAEDDIPSVAAGITFFALLALFPGIAALFSLYGLIGDPASIGRDVQHLSGFLPGGAITVLGADIERLSARGPQTLGVGFAIGLLVALWSASGGIKALIDGINLANETRETRGFVGVALLALSLVAIAIAFVVAATALATVLPEAIGRLHPNAFLRTVLTSLLWPLAYGLCALTVALIYSIGPAQRPKSRRGILWSSLIVAALWIAGTFAFSWSVQNYGSYDRTYGSLGAAVGFLTWLWLSLTVLLGGAELAYELDREPVTPAA